MNNAAAVVIARFLEEAMCTSQLPIRADSDNIFGVEKNTR